MKQIFSFLLLCRVLAMSGGGSRLWFLSLAPFKAVGELMSCVHIPRFILLGSFSDTLLVVSILDSLLLPFVGGFAVHKGLLIVLWKLWILFNLG